MWSASLRAGISAVTETRPDGRVIVASARNGRATTSPGRRAGSSDALRRPRIQAEHEHHQRQRGDEPGDHQHRRRCRVHQHHLERSDRHLLRYAAGSRRCERPAASPPPSQSSRTRGSIRAPPAPATTARHAQRPPIPSTSPSTSHAHPGRRHSHERTLQRVSRPRRCPLISAVSALVVRLRSTAAVAYVPIEQEQRSDAVAVGGLEVETEAAQHAQGAGVARGGVGSIPPERPTRPPSAAPPAMAATATPRPRLLRVSQTPVSKTPCSSVHFRRTEPTTMSATTTAHVVSAAAPLKPTHRSRWNVSSHATLAGVHSEPAPSGGVTSSAEASGTAACTSCSSTTSSTAISPTGDGPSLVTTPSLRTGS